MTRRLSSGGFLDGFLENRGGSGIIMGRAKPSLVPQVAAQSSGISEALDSVSLPSPKVPLETAPSDSAEILTHPQFFQLLVETMNEGLGVREADGNLIYANDHLCDMLGYPREALIGRPMEDFATEASRKRLSKEFARRRKVMSGAYELELERQDGEVIAAVFSAMALHDTAGSFIGSFAVVTDVTERREAETALAHSEERFRRIFEQGPLGVTVVDLDLRFVQVNEQASLMLGYTEEELLGRHPRDVTFPDDRSLDVELAKSIFKGGINQYQIEKRYVRKDDSIVWGRLTATALKNEAGEPIYGLGLIEDITEKKVAENALKASERRYRDLFEGVPVGVFRADSDGRLQDVNRAMLEILGYDDRAELVGVDTGELYVEAHHRDAWFMVMAQEGQVPDFETRFYRKDEKVIWVRTHTRAILTADGQVRGYEGTVEDIEDRKRAEERLRESEERFRSLVQNTSDVLSLLDPVGLVRYESPSGRELSGYSERQRIGRDAFDIVHPEDRQDVKVRFKELLKEPMASVRLEYRVQNRDGSVRVCESVFTNQLGNRAVCGVVATTRDVTERKAAEDRLQHEALHDALTGLPNRVLFMDRLGHCLERRQRKQVRRAAVLFIDLDRFKMINDSLGHLAGDQLLEEASRRLKASIRPSDTLARLGGDEFAVLLEDIPDVGPAVRVADRIQRALAVPFILTEREVYTSASIGIALSQPDTTNPQDLLRDADTAMYRAKSRGRAAYAIFDARMHAQVVSQLKMETELRKALEEEQFEIFYQPIVQLATGVIKGFEAVVCWRHPERGVIPSKEFMRLAEESGLAQRLDDMVLSTACHQLQTWLEAYPDMDWFVSINISGRQLLEGDLVSDLQDELANSGLDGERLILELEEREVLERIDTVLPILNVLRDLGLGLALDDFGTGHSSLSLLQKVPVSQLKIDSGFVQGLDGETEANLVNGVLTLCRLRRLLAIAEGVETADQRKTLLEFECPYAQGRLFADPMSRPDIEAILEAGAVIETEDDTSELEVTSVAG